MTNVTEHLDFYCKRYGFDVNMTCHCGKKITNWKVVEYIEKEPASIQGTCECGCGAGQSVSTNKEKRKALQEAVNAFINAGG